jgi:hypothetical protein
MSGSLRKRLYGIVPILLSITVVLSVYSACASYRATEMVRSVNVVNEQQSLGGMPSLPPFANGNFDLIVVPYMVTLPQSGGSANVLVELEATNLTISETLVLETHANIPGYSSSFNTTSVTLNPGGSATVALTIGIPNGVQSGIYAVAVIAKGDATQGGGWLLISVGSRIAPPP